MLQSLDSSSSRIGETSKENSAQRTEALNFIASIANYAIFYFQKQMLLLKNKSLESGNDRGRNLDRYAEKCSTDNPKLVPPLRSSNAINLRLFFLHNLLTSTTPNPSHCPNPESGSWRTEQNPSRPGGE